MWGSVILIISLGMMGVVYSSAIGERAKMAEDILSGVKIFREDIMVMSKGAKEAAHRAYSEAGAEFFKEIEDMYLSARDSSQDITKLAESTPNIPHRDIRKVMLTLLLCIARGDGVGIDDAFNKAIDVCTATAEAMGQRYKATAPLFKRLGFLIGGVISVIML